MGYLCQTNFRVTHRRSIVAVHGTEVTLTIHQHVTQGEILRHTNDGVVNSGVAMGVVLTDHVTDDTGRLLVSPVPVVI